MYNEIIPTHIQKGEVSLFQKITDHLYVFHDTCQVYVITDGDSAILIDFGSGDVLQHLHLLSIHTILAVLITHHHRDQVQGLAKAYERHIPIYVPQTERELIEDADLMWQRREISNNYNNRQDRFSILYSVPVTGSLKDYSVLHIGSRIFHVWPTPGHTVGSVSLELEIDGIKAAFTGDLICERGQIWSLAATQWSYNGGEGIPYHILSLLFLKERGLKLLLPSHGTPMDPDDAIEPTVERLAALLKLRKQNPRLFSLRQSPYERITEHLLFNRTSMSNSYVLLSSTGKALIIDFGYDFMAGTPAGTDRSSRRPWLYTLPALFDQYGVKKIDACIPTHYHDDHVAGFNLLREVYQTKVLCAESFADILAHPADYDIPCLWYDPIPVDCWLPLKTPVKWEEYELILHPLPGHTRYAVAIEFTADGRKVLCTGDQYADEDGLFCNYVYKNLFDYDDFMRSAELYRTIHPDYILTGHWQYRDRPEEYYDQITSIGAAVSELHQKLLPLDKIRFSSDGFAASMSPYRAEAVRKTPVEMTVCVTNPFPYKAFVHIRLILPDGFKAAETDTLTWEAGPHETRSAGTAILTPDTPVRRARIACDITIAGHRLGQQAEMLITLR